jgi:hypothetical protein
MHPRFLITAAFVGTLANLSLPTLRAAETAAAPASKGGFFSRSSKPAEKTPPAEPVPQGNRKTSPPAASSGNGTPAPTATRTFSSSETKTAKRGGSKKPLEAKSEDELFSAVRLQALEDPNVGELRAKADKARDKDSGVAATKAYLRGLYGKMRDLEPGLKERIDLTETAAIQGLSRTQ